MKKFVVVKGHGVCEVKGIVNKLINGSIQEFLDLLTVDTRIKILLPSNLNERVRDISSLDEIAKAEEVFKTNILPKNETWNRRYRRLMGKIEDTSIIGLAEVIHEILALQKSKDLSFGEKKILETAKQLFDTEKKYSNWRPTNVKGKR